MRVLSRKRLASAALLLSLSTVCANISFVRIPPTIVQPGETIELQWNIVTPVAGTLDTQEPFNLQLRALSGQRYDLNKLVAQTAAKLRVVIPKEATGGLHSFYADYTGPINVKPTASNQFNITGAVVTTTTMGPTSTLGPTTSVTGPHGSGSSSSHTPDSQASSDGGLSGGALGGIIAGVVIFLLLIALIFFVRHRRLVRERSQHTRLDDSKESYSETSMARSGPPSAQGGDGMVSVPLSAQAPVYPSPFSGEPKPQPQHPMNQMQHANSGGNPFDAPDDRTRGLAPAGAMVMAADGSPRSLSPRQQHQPYQPPQFEQQPPRPQQQQYGLPVQQRSQSPFQQGGNRDSLDSEPESAYDPAHARMMPHPHAGNGHGPIMRNNSNPGMQLGGPPGPGSQLSYSPSGRSVMSDAQNMSHTQPHPHQQQQNPFQDRELVAAAAGGAAVGAIAAANRRQGSPSPNSPAQAHRHLAPMNDSRVQTPLPGQGSPLARSKEIEMQPLDVQQHQYEQQQRMLQRQQQQRQQAQAQAQAQEEQQQRQQLPPAQPIQQSPLPPTPLPALAPSVPAASHPFNPTLYDDKTEIDDDSMSAYNGYRDTIFGAYSQPQEDGDDDEDDEIAVPIVPASALVSAGSDAQKQQQRAADANASASGVGAGVQRKKSVKFTGVPLSDSIDVPGSKSQQQHQQQLYHSDGDEEEDEEDELEDEDDIKMRLMQTEVPSPSAAHARPPFINITPSASPSAQHHPASVLSPVRAPDQAHPSSSGNYHQSHGNHHAVGGGFPIPAPIPASAPKQQQQQQQPSSSHAAGSGSASPSLNTASSSFGNGFYEDVLAAVDKNSRSLPSSSTTVSHAAVPPQKHQPVMVNQEVYGAPSPRISAAVATPAHQQHLKSGQQPSMPKPYQQPLQQQHRGEHDAGFYESPLL
ncbi:hypothetical protein BGZ67_000434 [Mortierella alpina]|nr:hypothetical protein BGZ67_000434 [Mortierella alpina]